MTHAETYLAEAARIAKELDYERIEEMVALLCDVRSRKGRLFLVGLGGSAANCSHAASDFRKLAGIQAVSLCDNVSELTARANDEGFHGIYAEALNASNPKADDALFVFSVGGGAGGVSEPLVRAVNAARYHGMHVLGVVGRDGGYTKQHGDCVVVVPTAEPARVTPHTEAFHMVVLHCLVSHPDLQRSKTKW